MRSSLPSSPQLQCSCSFAPFIPPPISVFLSLHSTHLSSLSFSLSDSLALWWASSSQSSPAPGSFVSSRADRGLHELNHSRGRRHDSTQLVLHTDGNWWSGQTCLPGVCVPGYKYMSDLMFITSSWRIHVMTKWMNDEWILGCLCVPTVDSLWSVFVNAVDVAQSYSRPLEYRQGGIHASPLPLYFSLFLVISVWVPQTVCIMQHSSTQSALTMQSCQASAIKKVLFALRMC